MGRVFVIAEAGINHNGNVSLARKLITEAVRSGADAIKFQTFKVGHLVTKVAPTADYQKKNLPGIETQSELLAKVELTFEQFEELSKYAESQGLEFMSTAFDSESLQFLDRTLGPRVLKISSGDLTNGPFLLEHAQTQRNIILSTGMATLAEIEQALSVLAFGYLKKRHPVNCLELTALYGTAEAQDVLEERVSILHCVTEYPAPESDVNLRVIRTLSNHFSLPVGYSDHTEGILVPAVAVAMGAIIVEKHLTLDRSAVGPDHQASLEPREFGRMVDTIRQVEEMLGDSVKTPQSSELKNRVVARRSLVASKDIKAGERFTSDNVTAKRPGTGRSPMEYWDLLNEICLRNIGSDELIP